MKLSRLTSNVTQQKILNFSGTWCVCRTYSSVQRLIISPCEESLYLKDLLLLYNDSCFITELMQRYIQYYFSQKVFIEDNK